MKEELTGSCSYKKNLSDGINDEKQNETDLFSEKAIQEAIDLLEKLNADGAKINAISEEKRIALMKAAGQFSRPDRNELKERNKQIKKDRKREKSQQDQEARKATGIRQARESKIFVAPKAIEDSSISEEFSTLSSPRNCYICKAEFTQLHHFYDQLCPVCAKRNYQKRFQSADLTGQVALITGSRLKIGYQATLMLLRSGATVIATTRFPVDSALRFSKEEDFPVWKDRLRIYGLDLRHTPSVEIFTHFIEKNYKRLDILINNAAQTVRRPCAFYAHLMPNENQNYTSLPLEVQKLLGEYQSCLSQLIALPQNQGQPQKREPLTDSAGILQSDLGCGAAIEVAWNTKNPGIGMLASAKLSQIPYSIDNSLPVKEIFPEGELDADLQQVDLRRSNSWRLKLGEIPTVEMLELQLINSVAPFVLCNRLIPLMKNDYTGQKHIVNVSAMEGKFLRFQKGERHPHTNMAKAALNMLTHTAAGELAKHGIFMNAVDTGWVTDEDPAHLAMQKQILHDFQPPLDIVDGAARILDPLFDGINTGKHLFGKFLKDYDPIDW